MPNPVKMSEEEAVEYCLDLCAFTFELDRRNLTLTPDPGPDGWTVKDRSSGERYGVPAKIQRELGFPRGQYPVLNEDAAIH